MIAKGTYTFKVIDTRINENKHKQKYIRLTLEVQDEGPNKGDWIYLNIVPWHEFNWMNNINTFFSPYEIETLGLEDTTLLASVASLVFERTGVGTVKHSRTLDTSMTEYASVMMCGKYKP